MLGDETANALGLRTELFRLLPHRGLVAAGGRGHLRSRDSSASSALSCRISQGCWSARTINICFRRRPCSALRWSRSCDTVGRVILPPGEKCRSASFSRSSARRSFCICFARAKGRRGEFLCISAFAEFIGPATAKRTVLRSLAAWTIPRGKVVTVIGQNGCGKSTTAENRIQGGHAQIGASAGLLRPQARAQYAPKKLAQQDRLSFAGPRRRRPTSTCARWSPTAGIPTRNSAAG